MADDADLAERYRRIAISIRRVLPQLPFDEAKAELSYLADNYERQAALIEKAEVHALDAGSAGGSTDRIRQIATPLTARTRR